MTTSVYLGVVEGKCHGSRGFLISGLPGLTQRGTRRFLLNAHVAGRVLVLRQIAKSLIEFR